MSERSLGEAKHEIVRGFRQRGHRTVGRIESFSDAVFGFSVTLLVVSQQVPKTFDQLLQAMHGFPAFALSFSLLAQIWFLQNRFFRRYGLQDAATVTLNLALLFVVVFFTYPLKFLFTVATADHINDRTIRPEQLVEMFAIYSMGYVAVFGILLALLAHAYRKRDEIALSPVEQFETKASMARAGFQIFIGALSYIVAWCFNVRHDYGHVGEAGGLTYLLIPIGLTIFGAIAGRRRRRLETSL